MLLTPTPVRTHGNIRDERSKAVSFKGTKSKIEPDEAILSVKQPLEKPYIPAVICLVQATQMMCNLKQFLSSK